MTVADAAMTLPASMYRDPAVYERERAAVFGREWLVFARGRAARGSGRVRCRCDRGLSARDRRRSRRCAARLPQRVPPSGRDRWSTTARAAPSVRVPVPRVVVRHDGPAALNARDFDAAGHDTIDPDEFSLFPVRVERWRNLVFVNLDADAAARLARRPHRLLRRGRAVPDRVVPLRRRARARPRLQLEDLRRQLPRGVPHPVRAPGAESRDRCPALLGRRRRPLLPPLGTDARRRGRTPGGGCSAGRTSLSTCIRDAMVVERDPADRSALDADRRTTTSSPTSTIRPTTTSRASPRRWSRRTARSSKAVQRNLDAGVYERGRLSPRHESRRRAVPAARARLARTERPANLSRRRRDGASTAGGARCRSTLPERSKQRHGENFSLHEQYLNPQLARVLKTLGFDRYYVRGEGCYLYDDRGEKYLDFLAGFGVFALGRSHPGDQGGAAPGDRPRSPQHGADGLRAASRPPRRAAPRRAPTRE